MVSELFQGRGAFMQEISSKPCPVIKQKQNQEWINMTSQHRRPHVSTYSTYSDMFNCCQFSGTLWVGYLSKGHCRQSVLFLVYVLHQSISSYSNLMWWTWNEHTVSAHCMNPTLHIHIQNICAKSICGISLLNATAEKQSACSQTLHFMWRKRSHFSIWISINRSEAMCQGKSPMKA